MANSALPLAVEVRGQIKVNRQCQRGVQYIHIKVVSWVRSYQGAEFVVSSLHLWYSFQLSLELLLFLIEPLSGDWIQLAKFPSPLTVKL